MAKKTRKKLFGDVVVIGGGFAGIGAAIAAGRKGLTVYLVEASRTIGGTYPIHNAGRGKSACTIEYHCSQACS